MIFLSQLGHRYLNLTSPGTNENHRLTNESDLPVDRNKTQQVSHIRLLTLPIRFNVLPKTVNACRAVIRTGGNILGVRHTSWLLALSVLCTVGGARQGQLCQCICMHEQGLYYPDPVCREDPSWLNLRHVFFYEPSDQMPSD